MHYSDPETTVSDTQFIACDLRNLLTAQILIKVGDKGDAAGKQHHVYDSRGVQEDSRLNVDGLILATLSSDRPELSK